LERNLEEIKSKSKKSLSVNKSPILNMVQTSVNAEFNYTFRSPSPVNNTALPNFNGFSNIRKQSEDSKFLSYKDHLKEKFEKKKHMYSVQNDVRPVFNLESRNMTSMEEVGVKFVSNSQKRGSVT
jgi:hypothetical protein